MKGGSDSDGVAYVAGASVNVREKQQSKFHRGWRESTSVALHHEWVDLKLVFVKLILRMMIDTKS